jgi:hypothetical protein
MVFMSWVELRESCPINISRIIGHANSFNSLASIRITSNNLSRAKKSLIDARAELDLVFSSLQQVLYDREILKTKVDEVLYGWLIDNIGRYQKVLDEKEEELLIKFESSDVKLVGVARVSSYAKALKVAQQLIYESLLKSVEEYSISEYSKKEIVNKRAFMYILFQVLNITMSSVGGLARQGNGNVAKKGQVGNMPTTWQSLLSVPGQKKIVEKHNLDTGDKMEIPDFMLEDKNKEAEYAESNENTIFYEEEEEEENGNN